MMRVGMQQPVPVLHDANMARPKYQIAALQLIGLIQRIANRMLRP